MEMLIHSTHCLRLPAIPSIYCWGRRHFGAVVIFVIAKMLGR